ncbi:MAG: response regulator [Terriglobia bacterium]
MSVKGARQRTGWEEKSFIARPQILLIDDDVDDLEYTEGILQKLGCEVSAGTSFQDGLRNLEGGVWDFVVLSQGGPSFEGRRILESAGNINRCLPVLVLTSWHNMRCYLQAMQLGAVDYLEKPVSLWEMARLLETHLPLHAVAA